MKRIALMSAVLTVLVGADGLYMEMTNYQPKDVNHFNLSDGGTVLVAAGFLLLITIAAFILSRRSSPPVAR